MIARMYVPGFIDHTSIADSVKYFPKTFSTNVNGEGNGFFLQKLDYIIDMD